MYRNLFRTASAALLLSTVSCSGSGSSDAPLPAADALDSPAAAATAPSQPSASPPAGPVAGPRPEGEVEVAALRVDDVDVAGTHPAVACGRYFMIPTQEGVVYSFTYRNLSVTVMADDRRVPGLQEKVSIFANGGEEPLAFLAGQGGKGRIHFSDDFRTAEIDVMLGTTQAWLSGRQGTVPFRATFRCNGA